MSDLDWLLTHSRNSYHRGSISHATQSGTLASNVCADRVILQIITADGVVCELWHQAEGCMVSQSTASLLCETYEGVSVCDILNQTEEDYLAQLGTLTPRRQPCALQAFRCLKRILNNEYSLAEDSNRKRSEDTRH